ncbi:unnamed protein product [Brugia timori]|nr:unnamed protein product [Brugia timori]
MYIDIFWIMELFCVVFLTSFSLYATYLLPLQYCDLIHRCAAHLGKWERLDRLTIATINSNSNCYYNSNNINGINCSSSNSSVAAEPGDSDHSRFYRIGGDPITLTSTMVIFQVILIGIQFWMLILTTDWQHIVTLVLLIFANYLLLAKTFKDRVIIGRIYKPSPEDLQLIKQMQQYE